MQRPILIDAIPAQITNEQAAYGPLDLNRYVRAPAQSGNLFFEADLKNGEALPKGLICTRDGIVTGIPAKNTHGIYEINLTIGNDAGTIETDFIFEIKPSLAANQSYYTQLKQQIWEALEQCLPAPELTELYNRPISPLEIYHLLERWGIIKIWDAYNLDAPGELVSLTLEGASSLYAVYDRGSCLVAGPKNIFSHEHTAADGLKTAKALAREAFKRNWTVEVTGLDKFTRAMWVELQILGEHYGQAPNIINYQPSAHDELLFLAEKRAKLRPESKG